MQDPRPKTIRRRPARAWRPKAGEAGSCASITARRKHLARKPYTTRQNTSSSSSLRHADLNVMQNQNYSKDISIIFMIHQIPIDNERTPDPGMVQFHVCDSTLTVFRSFYRYLTPSQSYRIDFIKSNTIACSSSIDYNSANCEHEEPHELNIVFSTCRTTLCSNQASIALVLLRSLHNLEALYTIRQLYTVIGRFLAIAPLIERVLRCVLTVLASKHSYCDIGGVVIGETRPFSRVRHRHP